ncbi:MAG TPA: hypothetical protein VIT44_13995 [Cyclobacteriaceae bacterium]
MRLSEEHISYIIKDLNSRGIVLDGLQDEVIDHVCSAVEKEMAEGKKFIDAYNDQLKLSEATKVLKKYNIKLYNQSIQKPTLC